MEGKAAPGQQPLTPTEVGSGGHSARSSSSTASSPSSSSIPLSPHRPRPGARIGEILVEQGALTRLDLASALGRTVESTATVGASPSPGGLRWRGVARQLTVPAAPLRAGRRMTAPSSPSSRSGCARSRRRRVKCRGRRISAASPSIFVLRSLTSRTGSGGRERRREHGARWRRSRRSASGSRRSKAHRSRPNWKRVRQELEEQKTRLSRWPVSTRSAPRSSASRHGRTGPTRSRSSRRRSPAWRHDSISSPTQGS